MTSLTIMVERQIYDLLKKNELGCALCIIYLYLAYLYCNNCVF